MPRQFGKVDASAARPWGCTDCGARHAPGVACPPVGVWLVLTLCPYCRADTGHYCLEHRGRRS